MIDDEKKPKEFRANIQGGSKVTAEIELIKLRKSKKQSMHISAMIGGITMLYSIFVLLERVETFQVGWLSVSNEYVAVSIGFFGGLLGYVIAKLSSKGEKK